MVFRKEHLCGELAAIYNFGYCNAAGKCEDDFLFRFSCDFKEKVLNRIGVLFDAAKYIIIEENYVEREWKEMIARHYLHSAYANALREKVIRVHFLEQKEFCDENYLGYITLRPIEELAISLSFIYINLNLDVCWGVSLQPVLWPCSTESPSETWIDQSQKRRNKNRGQKSRTIQALEHL